MISPNDLPFFYLRTSLTPHSLIYLLSLKQDYPGLNQLIVLCTQHLQWGFQSEIYPEQPLIKAFINEYLTINCTQYIQTFDGYVRKPLDFPLGMSLDKAQRVLFVSNLGL